MSFSAPSHGAGYFPFGGSTKAMGAGHDGLANIRLARLPCASRRTRAGCDAQRHATAPESSLRHGHPWPAPFLNGYANVSIARQSRFDVPEASDRKSTRLNSSHPSISYAV